MLWRFLLIPIILAVASCSDRCIEAGSGVSKNSINLEVPAHVAKSNPDEPASYWIDSKERITVDQTLKMSVSGTINVCPKDTINPLKVLVSNVFCNNEPHDYTIDSIDPNVICQDYGGVSAYGHYFDSKVLVNPGDRLQFALVPNLVTVQGCSPSELREAKILFDPDGTYFQDKNCSKAVKSQTVCESGGSFYFKSGGKCYGEYDRNGQMTGPKQFKAIKGTSQEVLVSGTANPYGNVARIRPYDTISGTWVGSSNVVLDLRNAKPIDELNSDGSTIIDCGNIEAMKDRYTAYDINCNCGNICSTSVNDTCVSSLARETHSGSCSTQFKDWKVSNTGSVKSWAGSLIAKIGDTDISWGSNAAQCLPERNTQQCMTFDNKIEGSSVLLNQDYVIKEDVPSKSSVLLGVTDSDGDYYDNLGGYNVQVSKSCPGANGHRMYLYIGDTAPNIKPGEAGTYPAWRDDIAIYEINKDNPPKSGKIYFGVSQNGVDPDQFAGLSTELTEQNKYIVNLFRPKWNPNFSQFFVGIRDKMLSILYGASGHFDNISDAVSFNREGGVVHQIYAGYVGAKQFWLMVRALCVLYVMFSALGYILGLLQLTKADLIIRIIKISFVIMIFSPNSWQFFGEHFFALFVQGVDDLIIAFGGVGGTDASFTFLDPTLGVLLSGDTWIRFVALLLAGPFGWLIFLFVIWGTCIFFVCIMQAVMRYLMIIVVISFLLALSPLFITFVLFAQTKRIFDGWIKMLVNFSLQPVILFSCLAFLNQVMQTSLYEMVNYTACTQCAWEMKLYAEDEGGVCLFNNLVPVGFSNDLSMKERIREEESTKSKGMLGLPMSFVGVIMYVLLANAMQRFVHISEEISHSITGSLGSVSMAVDAGSQALLSVVGLDRDTQDKIRRSRGVAIDGGKINIEATSGQRPGDSRITGDKEEDKDRSKDTIRAAGGDPTMKDSDSIRAAGDEQTKKDSDSIRAAGGDPTMKDSDSITAAGGDSPRVGGDASSSAGGGDPAMKDNGDSIRAAGDDSSRRGSDPASAAPSVDGERSFSDASPPKDSSIGHSEMDSISSLRDVEYKDEDSMSDTSSQESSRYRSTETISAADKEEGSNSGQDRELNQGEESVRRSVPEFKDESDSGEKNSGGEK